jgi:hypothetical protein
VVTVTGVEGAIEKPAAALIVTEYVTVWSWNFGIEKTRVAFPVIVTVKVVVAVVVPLKVIRAPFDWPPARTGAVVLNVTVRPVPPMKEEERFTGPAKPAEFIAVVPDGRLPSAIVALAFEPELNVKLPPLS